MSHLDRPDRDGRGVPLPPCLFVDFKKLWSVVSDPTLFKGPSVSPEEGRSMVAEYNRQYNEYKRKCGTRSYGSWIKWKGYGKGIVGAGYGDFFGPRFVSQRVLVPKFATNPKLLKDVAKAGPNHHGYMDVHKKTLKNYYGSGVDVHALIGKLPRPKKGWTLPGHNYIGSYTPLDKQLDCDPETGEIFQIYQRPTGTTDAIRMQHDVDYSSCGHWAKKYGMDEKKCKHIADRKIVKALDSIPWKERQWGHALARIKIKMKQKLGLAHPSNLPTVS